MFNSRSPGVLFFVVLLFFGCQSAAKETDEAETKVAVCELQDYPKLHSRTVERLDNEQIKLVDWTQQKIFLTKMGKDSIYELKESDFIELIGIDSKEGTKAYLVKTCLQNPNDRVFNNRAFQNRIQNNNLAWQFVEESGLLFTEQFAFGKSYNLDEVVFVVFSHQKIENLSYVVVLRR